MAPTTRLRAKPDRRVDYAAAPRIEKSITPRRSRTLRSTEATPASSGSPTPRNKSREVTKQSPQVKGLARKAPKQWEKLPAKQECSICATTRVASQFKVIKDTHACEHFESICLSCIRKMLRTKVTERQLDDAPLPCPFPNCDQVLEYTALKEIVGKAAFEHYDLSLMRHLMSTNEFYQSCLSDKCGKWFSIEDCAGKQRNKKTITCPYCDFSACKLCHRPWKSHGKGGCDKVKADEEKQSEETIKKIGAKPCPNCGINILKQHGCDHMTCRQCNYHFCWLCLAPFGVDTHRGDCFYNQPRIAADPANWVPQGITLQQMNELIRRGPRQAADNVFVQPTPRPPNLVLPGPPPGAWGPVARPVFLPDLRPPFDLLMETITDFFD